MQQTDILLKIQQIVANVLGQGDVALTRESSAADYEKWDSLANLNIMMAVEQEFGFRFGLGELDSMKSVGDIVDAVGRNL